MTGDVQCRDGRVLRVVRDGRLWKVRVAPPILGCAFVQHSSGRVRFWRSEAPAREYVENHRAAKVQP